ncbi:TonB-dependent receptor [Alistipes senegalensis]|uniref:TonB-dependent receptor n=1 Tax=Alistipes senegalensis JC50 TaxID=1033732 RepID=A0ABY5V5R8_9BACT|nr:TonB-dependent receptor [Alistipes senegalensis]UEA87499.1 TonB-dependent receptor [Alistipes senegalensis]UWN64910.1 TonB-dependent receptor [Alistipes senegalensis JC50]
MKKLFLLMLSIFACCAANAQVTTSGMNGTVVDQNGQPLVGATVIAVHTPSGTQYGAVTDKNGNYNLQGLRTGGPYSVTFSFVGYQSVEFPGLMLSLGQTLKRDAFLKDSQELEAVIIKADGKNSSMNVNRAGAVTSISNEQIELMPTVNRSMNDIMKLTPQASSTTSGLAIGGGNYRQSYVTVDGAAFNNMFGIGGNLPAGGSPISLDALEQVSVSVTPFDVRQSGFTGGAINAVTKSGTNDLKVSAYLYSKSDQLQGDKYDGGKLSLSEMRDNTLGFSIGAPIIKNKLFVFANFEREWNTTPGNSRLARTNDTGEFGGNTQYNRPTASKLDEMSQFLIDTYGYNPGAYQNYSVKTPGYKLMARVDWNINRNHALNVRFSRTQNKYSSAPSSSISPLNAKYTYDKDTYGRTSNYAMYFQNSRYYQEQNFTSVAAELNSRFLDSRLTNTLRYTYSHQYEPRSYDGGIFPTVDILEPTDKGVSALYASFGLDPFTEGNLREVSTHIVTDEIGYTIGKNHLVAGLQFEHNLTTNGYLQGGAGYYVYESWDDFKNNKKPLAFRIAHGNNDALSQAFPQFTYMQYSIYLQDEINFSERFKATVGLRFEVPVYPSISDNENKDFTQAFADYGGYKTSDMPKARLSVAPRVGFNWDMTGERKYILRGGTGIFTGRLPFVWLVSVAGNSNCIQNGLTLYKSEVGENKMPSFHTNVGDMLKDVYGGTYQKQDLAANTQPTILDKKLKMPSTWKTSLALDLKLPGDVNLNIEGIYNKDINSVTVKKLGMVEKEGGIQLPGEPEARVYWNSQNIKNKEGKAINPYLITNTDDVDGYYASISAQLSKTWGFGLSVMAAYTYSSAKNVIDGIGDQVTSAFSTNTFNKNGSNVPETGFASYVSPHRILLNVGYRLANKNGASNFGLYYEASQLGYIGSYSYSRYSYTMYVQSGKYQNAVTGDGGAVNLLYIPTRSELDDMPFTSDENKEAFWNFIQKDSYLSEHVGEYSKRGGAVMPWYHTLNFRFSQDFYINVKGKRNTISLGLDVTNLANMLNRDWGNIKRMNSSSILAWDGSNYTFTAPKWSKYASTVSTWSAMFSIRYTFN